MSTLKRKAGVPSDGADSKRPKANGSITSFFGGAPKPAAAASNVAAAAPKFDKQKWIASLKPEQKKLLQLEIDTLDDSWLAHLKDDITAPDFLNLKKYLEKETAGGRKWFPPAEDVYSWSRHTPFHTVKVVVVGQDPYHNVNQAHGLAFSVRKPTPAPPSLKNMYIALKNDYPSFLPPPEKGGLLTPWADRGVLLLNTCLTVQAHKANSHANHGWERFTQRIIDLVAQKRTRGVVFMAWGASAATRVQKVDKVKHLILRSVHPSPLSASRGFFTCGHFKKANEWIVSRYGPDAEIDWALHPGASTRSVPELKAPTPDKVKAANSVDIEGDVDSDDEAALEEALRLAEEETKAVEESKEEK